MLETLGAWQAIVHRVSRVGPRKGLIHMALFLLYLFFLKFKVYNVMIIEYPFSEQPSFHIDTTLKNKKKIFFLHDENYWDLFS